MTWISVVFGVLYVPLVAWIGISTYFTFRYLEEKHKKKDEEKK